MSTTWFDSIRDKQRIVFAGAEGCETMAAIMAHVMDHHHRAYDLVIGDKLVKSGADASVALIVAPDLAEADGQAAFLKYGHHIGVITSIQYHHQPGFSSDDEYIRQYDQFADATPKGGLLAYCEQDPIASVLCNKERVDVQYIPFKPHAHVEERGSNYLITSNKDKLKVNLQDNGDWLWAGGAKEVLKKIGITSEQFYQSIPGFREP
ncbi:MAG: hypothetical protein ACKO3B_11695 [Bacteroidota bacterium]